MKNPDGWADPLVRPRGVGLRPAMPAFLRASASREDAARNGGMASRRLAPQTGADACAGFSTLPSSTESRRAPAASREKADREVRPTLAAALAALWRITHYEVYNVSSSASNPLELRPRLNQPRIARASG